MRQPRMRAPQCCHLLLQALGSLHPQSRSHPAEQQAVPRDTATLPCPRSRCSWAQRPMAPPRTPRGYCFQYELLHQRAWRPRPLHHCTEPRPHPRDALQRTNRQRVRRALHVPKKCRQTPQPQALPHSIASSTIPAQVHLAQCHSPCPCCPREWAPAPKTRRWYQRRQLLLAAGELQREKRLRRHPPSHAYRATPLYQHLRQPVAAMPLYQHLRQPVAAMP